MRTRTLGRTGLHVSELCLGTMTFGGTEAMWKSLGALDPKQSGVLVNRAIDAGINFFDTADMYGAGESETILGQALGARRKNVVIATKVGFPSGKGPNERGLSRAHLIPSVEGSLKRLGTDYIDVYLCHILDGTTPFEETVETMAGLVRAGKIRYWGLSNVYATDLMRFLWIAAERRWPRPEVLQAYYNLAARDLEREVGRALREHGVGLMAWSPLASGVLSGKYGRDGKEPAGSRRQGFDFPPVDWTRANACVDAMRAIAKTRDTSVSRVALAWLLAQDTLTTVIVGAKRLDQLDDNLGAAELALTPAELATLDAASALAPEYPTWMYGALPGGVENA